MPALPPMKMLALLGAPLAFVMLFGIRVEAAPYDLGWTRQLGTSNYDVSYGVTADGAGNVFISGVTGGDLDGNTQQGDGDAFLTKYDAAGNLKWTKQLGSSDYDWSNSVAVDGAGNLFISGYTEGDLDGNGNQGSSDAFLAKYDAAGNLKWTKQLGTSTYDWSNSVAVDGAGNVLVSGTTWGLMDGHQTDRSDDAFLAKYDAAGNLKWTKQLGTSRGEESHAVAVDGAGNIFISGVTGGDLNGNTQQGDGDAFLAKYDPAGNLKWTKQLGSSDSDWSYGVAVDQAGNVLITGETWGDLGGNGNQGNSDAFVAKYDAAGNLKWTKQLGTRDSDVSYGVAADGAGNVFITGDITGDLPGNLGNSDLFVTKYDADGNLDWTQQFETNSADYSRGVAIDGAGNVLISGWTYGDLDGNGNQGDGDAFVMKFSRDLLPGDLNGDDRVSLADLAILQSNLGKTSDMSWADGDLDGNNSVDRADLLILKNHYGSSTPFAASASAVPDTQQVPEPSSLALLALAVTTLSGAARRRRR